jgi:hypothetical protein
MRYLVFITIVLVLLSSCGTARIKKVRVVMVEDEIVSVQKNRSSQVNSSLDIAAASENVLAATTEEIETGVSEVILSPSRKIPTLSFPEEGEVVSNPNEIDERVALAYKAERHARRAYSNLMAAGITAGVGFIFPPLFLASLILFIIGVIYYSRASRAHYITEFGERRRKVAFIWLMINVALGLIVLLLTTFILLIFFL